MVYEMVGTRGNTLRGNAQGAGKGGAAASDGRCAGGTLSKVAGYDDIVGIPVGVK